MFTPSLGSSRARRAATELLLLALMLLLLGGGWMIASHRSPATETANEARRPRANEPTSEPTSASPSPVLTRSTSEPSPSVPTSSDRGGSRAEEAPTLTVGPENSTTARSTKSTAGTRSTRSAAPSSSPTAPPQVEIAIDRSPQLPGTVVDEGGDLPIRGRVWNDAPDDAGRINGVLDAGEGGYENIAVRVYRIDDVATNTRILVAETTTGFDGSYVTAPLRRGAFYQVEFGLNRTFSGECFTVPHVLPAPSSDAIDSDVARTIFDRGRFDLVDDFEPPLSRHRFGITDALMLSPDLGTIDAGITPCSRS